MKTPGSKLQMPRIKFRIRHWNWVFGIWSLVPGISFVTLVGCGGARDKHPSDLLAHLPRLEVVKPEIGPMEVVVELSAVVEPMEKADLCARVPGVVKSLALSDRQPVLVPLPGKARDVATPPAPTTAASGADAPEVDIGTIAKEGETLVQLDIPDLLADKASKEALLEQAEKQKTQALKMFDTYDAELKRNQEKHNRTSRLVKRDALNPELEEESRLQLESASAKREAALADLKVADSRIRVADAELKRLSTLVDYATIRAPFNGIITKRWVDRGNMVKDPGMPLLTIMRVDKVRILLDISQRDVPLINAAEQNPNPDARGDKVVLHIPALDNVIPGGEITGYITRSASALDPQTRTMRVEVHFANEIRDARGDILRDRNGNPVRPLKPGMFGTARVFLDRRENVLTIPSTSLVRRGDRVEVYCVENAVGDPLQGKVRRIDEVELGMDDGNRVEIRKGLTGQELIIGKGKGVLHAGDSVIAIPTRDVEPK